MSPSVPEGYIIIPCWSDGGEVKPIIDDNGKIPVTLSSIATTVDVNLKSSTITLPVSLESLPFTPSVNLASSDITLNVAEQNFPTTINSYNHGYISGAWQKSPFLFGISDVYGELETLTVSVGGTNNLQGSTVPAGEVWVVASVAILCSTDNPTSVSIRASVGGVVLRLKTHTTAVMSQGDDWQGKVYIKEDDYIKIVFSNCSVSDVLYAYIIGYKMDVDL